MPERYAGGFDLSQLLLLAVATIVGYPKVLHNATSTSARALSSYAKLL